MSPARPGYSPITHSRAEDLAWMAETGEDATGAARRLGVTDDALEKWCAKNDHADLLNRLRANERKPGALKSGRVAVVIR